MASADSADNEFRETSPEMNLKNFLWNGVKTDKQTNKKYSEITHKQINNASWIRRFNAPFIRAGPKLAGV